MSRCTNCGNSFKDEPLDVLRSTKDEISCAKCGYLLIDASVYCPNCSYKIEVELNEEVSVSSNQLIPLEGFSDEKAKPISFVGELLINRNLVESNDYTISEQEHAKIYKVDGRWYLENLASNETVFVKIKEKVELKNHDVILIGKSKFLKIKFAD